jgi:hypothetical protein
LNKAGVATFGIRAHIAIMSDDSANLHVKVRHRNRPPNPYKWEIYRGTDPIPIKRAMYGYPTEQAAANAGEKALRRILESEALKQGQGMMADKHSKPPKPTNNNTKSIDRWDDEGGAPGGGRSVRKRPRAKHMVDLATGSAQEPTSLASRKNPAAVELGGRGGPKGGTAHAKNMTKKQRSVSAKKAARARGSKN